jgi:hypothetical protein
MVFFLDTVGVVFSGLRGKTLYPMISSTAARTGMKLIKSCSCATTLQFLCCCALRNLVPPHLDVLAALRLPPGLRDFLVNNIGWLLRPSELSCNRREKRLLQNKASRRRRAISMLPKIESSVDVDSDLDDRVSPTKRARHRLQLRDIQEDTSNSDSEDIELAAIPDFRGTPY